jgi:hypothetical protein
MRSGSSYRSSPSVVTRTEQSAPSVAQTPTERRSFSYDPAENTSSSARSSNPCNRSSVRTEKVAPKATQKRENSSVPSNVPSGAERKTESRRSFSYDPNQSASPAVEQSYSAPRQYAPTPRSSNAWSRSSGTKAERNNQRN